MTDELTWSCHVCRTVRPDAEIGVVSRWRYLGPGVPVRENLRYCLTDEACVDVASSWRALGTDATSFMDGLPPAVAKPERRRWWWPF